MPRLYPSNCNRFIARRLFAPLALLTAAVLCLAPAALAKDPTTVPVLKRIEEKSREVAKRVMPATVGIINLSLANGGHMGEGSGVVISEDGLVLSAGHVLGSPGSEVTIVFADGRRATAKCLGSDHNRDTGLAKIQDPGKWPHVEMGHSSDLKRGSWILAMGHPGGIQVGRVPPLRVGRVLAVPASNSARGFIVTDATVISGDSGGPLYDLDGKVVGIHSNIGMDVNENRHVPIDVFHAQWKDLLAGKETGTRPSGQRVGGIPDPAKIRRFGELLRERLNAGDPEARSLVQGGRLSLTPEKMDELLAKWEKEKKVETKPTGTAASQAIDVLKFQRLFQDRLLAGDPEVLKLIKDGKMLLTPDQIHGLMEKWEKQSLAASGQPKPAEKAAAAPAAKPEPPKTADNPPAKKPEPPKTADNPPAKKPESKPDSQDGFPPMPEGTRGMMGLMRSLGLSGQSGAGAVYGKSSQKLLDDLAPIGQQAGRSTCLVLSDGKPVALGTIIRKDGYIVTKASEAQGKVVCKIAGKEYPATVVKTKADCDLAVLKVAAKDLTPIAWAEGDAPATGTWLVTPSADGKALGVGVVSIPPREIPEHPKAIMRNRAVVGVLLDYEAKEAKVREVTPKMPADKAGLKGGDVIVSVDGKATPLAKDVNQILGKHMPGDKLRFEILRDGKKIQKTVELMASDAMAPTVSGQSEQNLSQLSQRGGTISKRHSNFPNALTHDTILQATHCGGPLVNLDGRAVGLNIARADRTASYAIPVKTLKATLAELMAGVK